MSDGFNTLVQRDVQGFLQGSLRPLIVILGPTASGKTAFSIALARSLENECKMQNGKWREAEVVNADSRQLYRYMDIGTAKISSEEMRGIPHHLLDVLDPKEEATAAWYKKRAVKTIDEIHARGNVPLLVGGSMLYISAVIDDLQFLPSVDPSVRTRLVAEYEADGGRALYERLQKADPETAASFSPRNKPYLIRAMELLETVGKPSEAKRKGSSLYELLTYGMQWPREELVRRIGARTEKQFEAGWIDEVRSLLKRGYTSDDPGMKSQGYREIAEAISNGKWKMENGKMDEELKETIATKARQYAKRQMTWWKRDARIRWMQP